MTNTEAKLKAIAKYNRENTKTYCLRLNKKTDKDLIEFLESLASKQGFIKLLIKHSEAYKGFLDVREDFV